MLDGLLGAGKEKGLVSLLPIYKGGWAFALLIDNPTVLAGFSWEEVTASGRRRKKPIDERREVLMTTSDEVPGRAVVKVFGLVRGNSVRARSPGRDIQALGRTIVCGRVGVYAELLEESRTDALDKMLEEARGLGANAVVATRLATSAIMSGAAEVLAYGTAVELE